MRGHRPGTRRRVRKSVHVPMRIERDEGKARALRGDMDWQMIGSPDYVIDRARDFIAAGTQEFMLQMIPNRPAVYEELGQRGV